VEQVTTTRTAGRRPAGQRQGRGQVLTHGEKGWTSVKTLALPANRRLGLGSTSEKDDACSSPSPAILTPTT
jgi:hypothetical protein